MKLVAYVRVSSENAKDQAESAPEQERKIRAWCKANGHRLVEVLRDEGVSGANGIEEGDQSRPGLKRVLQILEDGEADGIVFRDLFRLARAMHVQEAIFCKVWKHGGAAFATDLGEIRQDDPDDPMRTAMRQMAGVFGQLERGMVTMRMRTGKRRKAARGGYLGGPPRYGFTPKEKELVPDEREQAAIARMRELAGQGLSRHQIAATLDAEGFPAKRGGRWSQVTVGRVLEREEIE